MRRLRVLLVGLAVLSLALMGPGGGGLAPANGAAMAGKVVKIGVDLPMSGGEAPNGAPTNNGVLLAIDEANKAGGPYKFEEVLKDDAVNGVHDPAQGAKNVQELIADPAVVAMVGSYNSNVGKATIPLTNTASLVQISPAQTNPTLTKGKDAAALRTKPNNYFRVCPTDDLQGPVGADYAYKVLKARRLAILDDTETYGKGIADEYEKEFKKLGGKVLSHDGIPKGTQDLHAILTKIKSEKPDLLFFGGITTTGGILVRKQMPDVGLKIPYMGGDGIQEPDYPKEVGDAAEGTYATVASIDATKVPAAKGFLAAYKAKFNQDVGPYSANAYVATKIIIDAVKAVGPNRAKVRAWVANLKRYKSIIGTFGFDKNGDTTNRIVSVYEVKNGQWEWQAQVIAGSV